MAPRVFGHIKDIFVGDIFPTRADLARAGIHRPRQAGISGSEKIGADSIVLSGGYEDDDDRDHEIIYTGEGGRDINTGKQVSDQFLSRRNLALAKSRDFELPVRVVRRVKEGYRYDGLYQVVDCWHDTGKSGFLVWRFRLVKIKDDLFPTKAEEPQAHYGVPERVEGITTRIIRDISISKEVKRLHDFRLLPAIKR